MGSEEDDLEEDLDATLVPNVQVEDDEESEEEFGDDDTGSLFTSLDAFDDALEITEDISQEENTEWLAELNASAEVLDEESESVDYDETEDEEKSPGIFRLIGLNFPLRYYPKEQVCHWYHPQSQEL